MPRHTATARTLSRPGAAQPPVARGHLLADLRATVVFLLTLAHLNVVAAPSPWWRASATTPEVVTTAACSRLADSSQWGAAPAGSATYDHAGNLTGLTAQRSGPCLPTGAGCSQTYAADARVLKTAVDAAWNDRHTLHVFSTLELRRAAWVGGAYTRDNLTEVPYLMAHGVRLARVVYEPGDKGAPEIGGSGYPIRIQTWAGILSSNVRLLKWASSSKAGECISSDHSGARE